MVRSAKTGIVCFLWLLRARFCQGRCFTVGGTREDQRIPCPAVSSLLQHLEQCSLPSLALALSSAFKAGLFSLSLLPSAAVRRPSSLLAHISLPLPHQEAYDQPHSGPIRVIQDYRPFSGSFTWSQSFLPWKVTFTGPGIRTWISLGGPFFSLPRGLLLLLFASVGSPPSTVPGTQ